MSTQLTTSNLSQAQENELMNTIVALILQFEEFDTTRNEPYKLMEEIYKNAENVTEFAHRTGNSISNEGELETGFGNINRVVKNFLENSPRPFMFKTDILKFENFENLKKQIEKEEGEIKKFSEMREQWNTLLQTVRESNFKATIILKKVI